MNCKKFTILSCITLFVFVIFYAFSAYYTHVKLGELNAKAVEEAKVECDEYNRNNAQGDGSTEDGGTNPDVDPSESFPTFLSIFNNALDYMNNAEGYVTRISPGMGKFNAKVNPHVAGIDNISLLTTVEVEQIRDKSGKTLLNYYQHGQMPPEYADFFDNSTYFRAVQDKDQYYYYKTMNKAELNGSLEDKWIKLSKRQYLEQFAQYPDQFLYDINADTIDYISYYNLPKSNGRGYSAKIRLKSEGAKGYGAMLSKIADFYNMTIDNIDIEFTFDAKGHFTTMRVNETMTMKYSVVILGQNITADISTANQYYMTFQDFNGTINEKI